MTSPPRRSVSAACCSSCCPNPRCRACSRSCCCTNPAAARSSPEGDLVLLDDQGPRALEPRTNRRGCGAGRAFAASRRFGPYTLQAAIAAAHATAPTAAETDWTEIAVLYDLLAQLQPSPVVDLNRAVAVAMRDGPAAGLTLLDAILARGELAEYHLAHSARGALPAARSHGRRTRGVREGTVAHSAGARAPLPRPPSRRAQLITGEERSSRARRSRRR